MFCVKITKTQNRPLSYSNSLSIGKGKAYTSKASNGTYKCYGLCVATTGYGISQSSVVNKQFSAFLSGISSWLKKERVRLLTMLIRCIMKKYLCIRFKLYYFLTSFIFFIYPFLLLLREFIFLTSEDKSMFNQAVCFFMAIFLCFLYMIVIIPTVQLLKMNSKEKYWYSDVFKKNKVYGNIRIAIKINSIIFIVIQILICFFNFFNNQSPVLEFFWMPLVVFMLFFGVYAIMAGIHLEIKTNQTDKTEDGSKPLKK